jgi:hypothetical protein
VDLLLIDLFSENCRTKSPDNSLLQAALMAIISRIVFLNASTVLYF